MAAPHSDLEHLLKSNDPPHPSQTSRVKDILRDKETELSSLGNKISQLECTLHTLRNKHANVASEIARYNNILSPIRRLPTEIVGEIFLHFAPFMHRDSNLGTYAQVKLPWTLGLVCRLWRKIALSLGRLWCVLDLGPPWSRAGYRAPRLVLGPYDDEAEFTELPQRDPDPCFDYLQNTDLAEGYELESVLVIIEACLQRSGRQPLFLRLWTQEFASPTLLVALSKTSARWKELVLVDPSQPFLDHVSTITRDLQGLQKISLTYSRSHRHFPFQSETLRNITQLTLLRVFIPSESCAHIPWSRLTEYTELQCSWGHGVPERLESYRKLTNLLVFCLDASNLHSTGVPVLLPLLRVAMISSSSAAIRFFEMPMFFAVFEDFAHAN
ncbi:hypothetical protein C8R47DRAFT_1133199 [Mycena vitilis]|nr:hypothetical protein C8R47DRAFT_1133199 [Mycena vitilis]